MSDVKLSRFESFPKLSFAPGLWVEFEGVQLIAVPDTIESIGQCRGCYFAGETHIPATCRMEEPEDTPRVCHYTCEKSEEGNVALDTVRFFDEPTYAKMRIKGEL